MPLEQSLCRQWLRAIDRGIKGDMNNALNRAVWRHESINVDTEPPSERGSHLLLIQPFALYRRRLYDVGGQRSQECCFARTKCEALDTADKPPLI